MILLGVLMSCSERDRISMSGSWEFSSDSLDWSRSIVLPGSTASNGIGDEIGLETDWTGLIVDSSYFKDSRYAAFREPGNIKVPFWLQPVKHYKGPAWYRRTVEVPDGWEGGRVTVTLERPHWHTSLYINGRHAGDCSSLGTPHRYDVTGLVHPGTNEVVLKVDNRILEVDPGVSSHSITDHTQTNWNGVAGDLLMEFHPEVSISGAALYPDAETGRVRVVLQTENGNGTAADVRLTLRLSSGEERTTALALAPGRTSTECSIAVEGEPRLWDEFSPELYTLEAELSVPGTGENDTESWRFGFRTLDTEGGVLRINGRRMFLRGTLDCASFPKTGYPPTDRESWLREFSICRQYGLNHVRFHSWCPPEAAFDAADELGIYMEVECSTWPNQTTEIGNGGALDSYVREESIRMLEEYGNHPSFCMMMAGNEPAGAGSSAYLEELVGFWKETDPRRLYSSCGGWPNLPVNDFLSDPAPRIQGWGQELSSIINAEEPSSDYDWSGYTDKFSQPVVSHEIGQWCVYPDFSEIGEYDGVLRARNLEIFRETLQQSGMGDLAEEFLAASGRLQTLCYKADIEAALRTENFGGFQMLGLSDFPGQGTALVGVLNPFWESKGYVTAEEFSSFCSSTVPLVRLPKMVFTEGDTLRAPAEVAHFGAAPLPGGEAAWTLRDTSGRIVARDSLPYDSIGIGNCIGLGTVTAALPVTGTPAQMRLELQVAGHANGWDIWVYPGSSMESLVSSHPGIMITDRVDAETVEYLENGGDVLLSLRKGTLPDDMGGDIKVGFSSIFWNTAWTLGQGPHTLGILCDPSHPAFASFPTEFCSNYQWWDAMSHSDAIEYAGISADIEPLVRVIDDWFTNRPLALAFEARVGSGRIIVSGIDFWDGMDSRTAGRQLLSSLLDYMDSSAFSPDVRIDIADLEKLF